MKKLPALIALVCTLLVCAAVPAAVAFDCGGNKCDTSIQNIRSMLELMRGLEFRAPVSLKEQSPDQAYQKIVALRQREGMGPDSLAAMVAAYEFLGMIPADFDLRGAFEAVNREHGRSMFDAPSNTVLITVPGQTPGWDSPMVRKAMEALALSENEFLLTRELARGVLDQNFNTVDLFTARDRNSDQSLAARALAGGDTVMMQIDFLLRNTGANSLLLKNPGLAVAQFAPAVSMVDRPTLARLPAAVRERITFPYIHGYDFVLALRQAGGWPLVNAAYSSPPLSTEQILHPEKYYEKRDVPVSVDLPPLDALAAAGYEPVYDDVLGELGLRLFLQQWLASETDAVNAAAGWGGDRTSLLRNKDGSATIMILYTTWDTAEDAVEFAAACGRALKVMPAEGVHNSLDRIARDVILIRATTADIPWDALKGVLLRASKSPVIVPPPAPASLNPDTAFFDQQLFYSMISDVKPAKPDHSKNWSFDGNTYTHKRFGYRITAPNDNWVFQPFTLGSQVITEFTAFHKGYVGSEITLESFDRPKPGEMDPLDDMVLFVQQQMGHFQVVDKREFKAAGLPAREVTLKGVLILPITARYTEVVSKDRVFVFTAATASYLFARVQPEFDAFIESFELVK